MEPRRRRAALAALCCRDRNRVSLICRRERVIIHRFPGLVSYRSGYELCKSRAAPRETFPFRSLARENPGERCEIVESTVTNNR